MTAFPYGRRAGLMTCVAATAFLLGSCTGTPVQEAGSPAGVSPPQASTAAPAPPEVPAPTAAPPKSPAPGTLPTPTAAAVPALAASPPVSVAIPATGTNAGLLHLGLRTDGSLEVPPEPPGSPASWYTGSPTPGEPGPAVLLGHVNATGGGPGVFADLRKLLPGDQVEVAREDGSTAVFVVERAEQYGKDNFPTLEVYGNTEGPELRLITCDGFAAATGTFDDNYVVYAKLRQP